jgi:hypothetical protein
MDVQPAAHPLILRPSRSHGQTLDNHPSLVSVEINVARKRGFCQRTSLISRCHRRDGTTLGSGIDLTVTKESAIAQRVNSFRALLPSLDLSREWSKSSSSLEKPALFEGRDIFGRGLRRSLQAGSMEPHRVKHRFRMCVPEALWALFNSPYRVLDSMLRVPRVRLDAGPENLVCRRANPRAARAEAARACQSA